MPKENWHMTLEQSQTPVSDASSAKNGCKVRISVP